MAFKTVASLDADTTLSLGKPDEKGKTTNSIEGYYLGFRTTTNSYGDSNLHVFQTPKGNVGVWGSTNMDQKLKSVKPGTMTRVTANGLAPKKPGKNPMKLFEVAIDTDNTIEVAGGAVESFGAQGADTDDGDDDMTYAQDEEAEAFAPPAKSAAQRQAEVQAMLAKGKAKTGTR